MNYNVGDIFTDDEFYTDRANFCNENGFFIEEIEPLENDIRQFTIVEPPKTTLEEARSSKLSELSTYSHQFDNSLVNNYMIVKSSLGFKVNADLRSQSNINGLISENKEPVLFVDSEDNAHSLSIAQLNTLLSECTQNCQYLYQQKWAYRDQINKCKTVEEINAISFNFKMKDFSKNNE